MSISALALNYYNPPLYNNSILYEPMVQQLVDIYDPKPAQSQNPYALTLNQNAAYFNVTDSIWTLNKKQYLGYLTLPVQIDGSECRDGPPLKYLTSKNTTCLIENLSSLNCSTLSDTTLSLGYFMNDFKVLPVNKKSFLNQKQKYFLNKIINRIRVH